MQRAYNITMARLLLTLAPALAQQMDPLSSALAGVSFSHAAAGNSFNGCENNAPLALPIPNINP